MIVDVHCHAWPDRIASLALSGRTPQLERRGDGTIGGLRRAMAAAGADQAVVLGIADEARHVDGVNRFVARCKRERVLRVRDSASGHFRGAEHG